MDASVIDNLKASMLLIKGGTFMMGDQFGMYKPIFSPKIKKVLVKVSDFHICNHTVTQAEWAAVMGTDCNLVDAELPVVGYSWHQIYKFIEKLNKETNWNFRLPTEAEWEYAARGGELTDGSIYSGKNILDTIGWYNVNSENKLHPIAQKESNQLGLYDMSGNVWEWCQDVYEAQYKEGPRKSLFSLERLPSENPQGGIVGDYRVIRGGSYRSKDTKCWVFYREKKKSVEASSEIGFRLVY